MPPSSKDMIRSGAAAPVSTHPGHPWAPTPAQAATPVGCPRSTAAHGAPSACLRGCTGRMRRVPSAAAAATAAGPSGTRALIPGPGALGPPLRRPGRAQSPPACLSTQCTLPASVPATTRLSIRAHAAVTLPTLRSGGRVHAGPHSPPSRREQSSRRGPMPPSSSPGQPGEVAPPGSSLRKAAGSAPGCACGTTPAVAKRSRPGSRT